jgi:hypothetical protein
MMCNPTKRVADKWDLQRSCDEVGKGRSGLLPRPITGIFGLFLALGIFCYQAESTPQTQLVALLEERFKDSGSRGWHFDVNN